MILEMFESLPAPECRRFITEVTVCEGFENLPSADKVELIRIAIESQTESAVVCMDEDPDYLNHFDAFCDDMCIYVVEPKPAMVTNL